MRRILFVMLALVLAIGLTLPAVFVAADGTRTIYVGNIPPGGVTGGTDHDFCSADPDERDQWHFVLNGLNPREAAPLYMTAVFAVDDRVVIERAKLVGGPKSGNAHYTLEGYLNATLLSGYVELATNASYINFVLSHAPCAGDNGWLPRETLEVRKTAVTSYTRTHNWSIDKSVAPGEIWLYVDGSGDETATWTIDVTYEGYEDSDFNVSGHITIENTGVVDAVITGVEDVLGDTLIDVDFGVDFPYTLEAGEALIGTYSEDVESKIEGDNMVTVTTEEDEYTAYAEIVWGEPTTEVNKTVQVFDNDEYLGEVTAPNSATFTYDNYFQWEDYGADNCGPHRYDNTAKVIGDGGALLDSDDATLLVNVQCYIYETAYAKAATNATCFIPTFSNWGWTNRIGPGTYTWDLWAGAGRCDTSKGTLVGSVTVMYAGGYVTATYNVSFPYSLKETRVYAGTTQFPQMRVGRRWVSTVAPGQYYNAGPFTATPKPLIYVIAHAKVGIPDPNFGP